MHVLESPSFASYGGEAPSGVRRIQFLSSFGFANPGNGLSGPPHYFVSVHLFRLTTEDATSVKTFPSD